MKIAIGSDHRGLKLKEEAVNYLQMWGFEVVDFGTESSEECDYPKYAYLVSNAVVKGEVDYGILICGTGIGMSIAANKVKGIRAARCMDWQDAKVCREHGNANVLCMADDADVSLMMETWLAAEFEGGKHARRINQITAIEDHAS